MTSVPATITGKSINILLDGRMKTIPKGHVNFSKIEKLLKDLNALESAPVGWRDAFRSRDAAIKKRMKRLRELLDIPAYVEKMSAGRVKVTDKGVMFNDTPMHNAITEQLMKLVREGQDVAPLAHFLDRLMSNPTKGVREDLYAWIESGDLALTPDGCFLAFKKVAHDYSSIHRNPDGTAVDNTPGQIVSMPRELVDDNRDATCSHGLHFCSWSYLASYGWGGEDKVVILKIGPEDVVAIPTDYNRSKGRSWCYEVVGEVPEEECEGLFSERVVYGGEFGDPLAEVDNPYSDDHWEDEDWVERNAADDDEDPFDLRDEYEQMWQEDYDYGHADGMKHALEGRSPMYKADDLIGQDDDAYYKGYIDGYEEKMKTIYG